MALYRRTSRISRLPSLMTHLRRRRLLSQCRICRLVVPLRHRFILQPLLLPTLVLYLVSLGTGAAKVYHRHFRKGLVIRL